MQNLLRQLAHSTATPPGNNVAVIATHETLRLSAAALLQDKSESDAGAKFLTLGLVAIAHIVLLSTLANNHNSQPVDWHDPKPISVAFINEAPIHAQAKASHAPAVVETRHITPVSQAKPLPATISAPVSVPTEKSISEPSTSAKANTEPSEPAKLDKVAPTEANTASANNSEKANAEVAIVAPKFNANYLQNPAPEYPRSSQRRGEQGKVMLKVLVNAEGLPERVVVEQSSGYEALDKSALQAVKNWKFIPASSNNHPVSGSVIVPIRFNLDS